MIYSIAWIIDLNQFNFKIVSLRIFKKIFKILSKFQNYMNTQNYTHIPYLYKLLIL